MHTGAQLRSSWQQQGCQAFHMPLWWMLRALCGTMATQQRQNLSRRSRRCLPSNITSCGLYAQPFHILDRLYSCLAMLPCTSIMLADLQHADHSL